MGKVWEFGKVLFSVGELEESATCGEDGLCEDLRAIESFLADAENGIGGLEMEKWM